MDTRVKGMWLDALRSGDYTQVEGVLAKLDSEGNVVGYCCLGVLCDLAVKEGVIPEPIKAWDDLKWMERTRQREESGEIPRIERIPDKLNYGTNVPADLDEPGNDQDNNSTASLPEPVRAWAGLGDSSPEVEIPNPDAGEEYEPDTIFSGLAEVNDGGTDFVTIAGYIEDQL